MKFVVIGGNPAGLSAASAVRRAHPDWDIMVYEMGEYISYGSCGLPYYVSGVVEKRDKLMTLTPEILQEKRKIPLKLWHEVISVDFDKKNLTIKDIKQNKEFNDTYDYLLIATGGKPKIKPELSVEHNHIFKIHTIPDADKIKDFLNSNKINSAILIGAGYIGLEMLESYKNLGIEDLTIIGPRLVFRSETEEIVKAEIEKHNVKVIQKQYIKNLEAISDTRLKVTLENGEILESDMVQISVGVVPNTDFLLGTDLKMMKGAIITDEYMKTNIKDVFAAGDCCVVYDQLKKSLDYVPLAPAANKQGKQAGLVIAGKKVDPYIGVIGTSIFKVFDLYCAKTGLSVEEAAKLGYDAFSTQIKANEVAHYYPNKGKMSVLLVFDRKSHAILGAEITAPSPLGAKKIDIIATALYANLKIDDLQKLDLAYAPPFSPVYDPIIVAANIARKKCI